MERACYKCNSSSKPLHRHHLIPGRGKRKSCETEHSLIDLCFECHAWIHSSKGSEYWKGLKLQLQQKYFDLGYSEEETRRLMGGKIYL